MCRILALSCVACGLCFAQLADDSKPATSNVPGAEYPRVHSDLRVTFRATAPGAQKVQLQPGGGDNGLGKGPYEMVRDEKGVWSVTTPPAAPGFHYYWLIVDGFPCNDPSSQTYFGWAKETSGVEVPDKADFYEAKDVPHGDVRIRWYFSKTTGQWRRAYVYTPPGYDKGRMRYPVLYLQHGSGENERGWTMQGRVNFILDNLLAAKSAKPMIVVMENGMVAVKVGAARPQATTVTAAQPPPGATGAPRVPRGNEAFEEVAINDLIPIIDTTYRTIPDREHRAIAGLSMGAGQALQIGFDHLDKFAHIGSFSGGVRTTDLKTAYNGAFADPAAFNKKVRLFWIGSGQAEQNRHIANKAAHETLEKAGIKNVFFECPFAHEWQTWRYSLHDFAPRLFR
jgi:enterochelin esterase-like enzyme